jgi:alanine dehydrogenase
MLIGVPKEVKQGEYRVALTPDKLPMLVEEGHRVLVQAQAGEGAGFSDSEYEAAGATIAAEAKEVFANADIVIKVKEPQPQEYTLLQEGQVLFTYLHLAAEKELAHSLLKRKVTGIAYETVQLQDGSLPLLYPMSEIAGRIAPQIAAQLLQKPNGGLGKLLSGVPGIRPCHVVIIGGGTVGTNAAITAMGLGAIVTVVDLNLDRLRYLSHFFHGRVQTLAANPADISYSFRGSDVVIGAVLVPGALSPKVITRRMLGQLPGGAIVMDVAIDQGGCVEAIHPTSHGNPTYQLEGVTYYAVPNMPAIASNTSSHSLSNATIRYILTLANNGLQKIIQKDLALTKGVNTYQGHVTNQAVAEALEIEYVPITTLVSKAPKAPISD